MGRSIKPRTVCSDQERSFIPASGTAKEEIQLTIEEYETIRLIDYARLSQLECSEMMNVARTTVQSIYETARYKLADALMHQKAIIIKGGNYTLCHHGHDVKHCAKNINQ
ncbi:MAG: DUF134 domain-containing protein [Acholeplasmataceae bacterium]|nr:DUF134 domain-containing protein [Acholeplasmataceae bacterium]